MWSRTMDIEVSPEVEIMKGAQPPPRPEGQLPIKGAVLIGYSIQILGKGERRGVPSPGDTAEPRARV